MTSKTSEERTTNILQFRYPKKYGRPSDKARIVDLFSRGIISKQEHDSWLKEGGHI